MNNIIIICTMIVTRVKVQLSCNRTRDGKYWTWMIRKKYNKKFMAEERKQEKGRTKYEG